MTNQYDLKNNNFGIAEQLWNWWPLLPLYPYGRRRTFVKEIIPKKIWSFEQLQGLYYVAVPVRLTVVKVEGGLMLVNPLPPTKELLHSLNALEKVYGPVLSIVLPTASGLEHKIALPAMARSFPEATLWVCPGQWSFPFGLPLSWLGIPSNRTKLLIEDGVPHSESCTWISLGPLDIGLGRFQEISCFHRPTGALLVTDSLIGIEAEPPELFSKDPTPLLFHARDRGDQPLLDSPELRRRGWARVVLFSSFLRPECLDIPPLLDVLKYAFRPGLINSKAHFGLFPFSWKKGWEKSAEELIGRKGPLLQIAPVLERLVFPRAKEAILDWLDELSRLKGMRMMVSAHYSRKVPFGSGQVKRLKNSISKRPWAISSGNWSFLNGLDSTLLRGGIVPKDPLETFRD